MTTKELAQYLLQALNMGLGSIMQGESSFTNSFHTAIMKDGFLFIPRLPASYIIDDELYQKIFLIANAALYPRYTVLKQNSAYFVALDTEDIHVQRGLFFPWKEGISERLVISDLDQFVLKVEKNMIPIMKNLALNFNKVTSIAISILHISPNTLKSWEKTELKRLEPPIEGTRTVFYKMEDVLNYLTP